MAVRTLNSTIGFTRWAALALITTASLCAGCGAKIVTVNFPDRDGNSEYWVCNRRAKECHGKGEKDVDPRNYKPNMDSLAPPEECPHGVAKMEIVTRKSEVVQIGFECAQPQSGPRGPGGPTGMPDEPTGMPDEPTGMPDESGTEPDDSEGTSTDSAEEN